MYFIAKNVLKFSVIKGLNEKIEHKTQHVKVRTKRSLALIVTAKSDFCKRRTRCMARYCIVCMCVPKFVQLNYKRKQS